MEKSSRRMAKEKKDKPKRSIICYKCKMLGHLKSKCLELKKSQEKKKLFKTIGKKGLMSTWEDLDEGYDEDEANICLMADTTYV